MFLMVRYRAYEYHIGLFTTTVNIDFYEFSADPPIEFVLIWNVGFLIDLFGR